MIGVLHLILLLLLLLLNLQLLLNLHLLKQSMNQVLLSNLDIMCIGSIMRLPTNVYTHHKNQIIQSTLKLVMILIIPSGWY